jgi:hypothetical protein
MLTTEVIVNLNVAYRVIIEYSSLISKFKPKILVKIY